MSQNSQAHFFNVDIEHIFFQSVLNPETYLKLCQTSKMELYANMVNGCQLLTIFPKDFILDIWQDFEEAS